MPSFAQLVPPGLGVVQAVDVGDEGHLGDKTWNELSNSILVGEGGVGNIPGWMSLVATMESFLPWKTTVQLRITTDYNLYFRNVGFLLWRTGVIEKASHQVYSGPKMFWCWSPREENEGFSKYINFCWNIFLLAETSGTGWFLLQLFAIIINIIWPLYLAQLCCGIHYKYLCRFSAPLWLLL